MTADYRLGNALFEALDELIQSGHINPQLALKVLNQVSPSTQRGSNLFSNTKKILNLERLGRELIACSSFA
jgi:hypothetical protein